MILKENGEDRPNSNNKEFKQKREAESECDSARNFVSSQVEAEITEDSRAKRVSKVSKMAMRKEPTESPIRCSRSMVDRREHNKLQLRQSNSANNRKRPDAPRKVVSAVTKVRPEQKFDNVKVMSGATSEQSEGTAEKVIDQKALEEFKEIDISDEAPNCDQSVGTDNETVDTEENSLDDDKLSPYQKIEEMEIRIEKLEEELREVAALEISLYSVIPEHGSSAHKVHTPARRLSRLFIYACKNWSQDKRATVARNIASGLVMVAKSCGNDVARLTFWISNVIVLREIISQVLGSSFGCSSVHKNGVSHKFEGGTSPHQWYSSHPSNKPLAGFGSFIGVEVWQETSTFRIALEKIESWIFARVVDSVWWQTFTPHMQSPIEDTYKGKGFRKLLGPALGDQWQGVHSINLWKDAFYDAFTQLCPVRAGGNECGCLPTLARMVMNQCVTRLDVAMFNAILRESANQIPTDPVSDPIVDARILPIPAGDLSFGSGAQLKNAIGHWSRLLSELFGIDTDDSAKDDEACEYSDTQHGQDGELKCFLLLNSLSDLLMLPKDLLNNSVRKEVCPHISLPLVVRILCNFTPDDFCPDPVPCAVLEDLNYENLLERQVSGNKSTRASFPYSAPPLCYCPPSAADTAQKVGDLGTKIELRRNVSMDQRRGYTSDEDLDDLDSPLRSILDRTPPVSPANGNGSLKGAMHASTRFELLRKVWST